MSQYLLARKLQEKLGFIENENTTKRMPGKGNSDRIKKRHVPKDSIELAPPDRLLISPAFLKFNLKEKNIDQQQIQKIRLETGLEYKLQRDLFRCHLDAYVAKLIFYSHKFNEITQNQGTIGMACDYVGLVRGNLEAPASPSEFWTSERRKYLPALAKLRARISANRPLAKSDEQQCIDDFLDYLKNKWGIH